MIGFGPLEIVAILVVVVVLVLFVGGAVLLISLLLKKKGGEQKTEVVNEANIPSAGEKKEILEMLAKKEISKEEAENRLKELGSPVPEPQEQKAPSNNSKGCLIAVIVALIAVPLIFILLFLGLFLLKVVAV